MKCLHECVCVCQEQGVTVSLTADNNYNCSKWLWFKTYIRFEDVQLSEEDGGKESVGISLITSPQQGIFVRIPLKRKILKKQKKWIRTANKDKMMNPCKRNYKPHIRSYSTGSCDTYTYHWVLIRDDH